ncbi:heavy-metal-associated domain-containing protein [Enhygromyxa salina]|uniref:Copper chaperone CopZ n=1 Tax=Enhygromyxa salina TaxID=215803 RepID=A0A2S9YBX2_9BACT|nr:heavy metal-associated domain-containing protein [Enhygromyxa salina]PRQ02605.1 Copper chaperone CopZ [Enhygromyxa salina]
MQGARRLQSLLPLALCVALLLGCRGEPQTMRVELAVAGMTCDTCVQAITHEVGRLEGVRSVEVDLEAGKAVVTYTQGAIEPAAIEQVIEKIGYEAEPGQAQPVEAPIE